ncbi:MAG: carboxypeptidase-like regulatory domain-containing protein, partial [Planctomycetota bacterium]
MKRFVLVVALACSAALLVWFLQTRERDAASLTLSKNEAPFEDEEDARSELTLAEKSLRDIDRASLTNEDLPSAQGTAGVAVSGLVGKVVAADGLALGEPVRVVARWQEDVEGERGAEQSLQVEVDANGSFALPLERDLPKLELDVLADFLSLAQPARVARAEDGPLVLEVGRGALLLVELMGAAALEPDAQLGEAFAITASLAAGPTNHERSAFLGEDGGLRIGGLPPENGWWVRLAAEDFIDAEVAVAPLEANTVSRVQVPVERGVSAAGVLTAPNGSPVAGATVTLRSWKQADARRVTGREESVETDRDGAFLVGGVIAGEITLTALADGMLFKTQPFGERVDGE